MPERDSIQEQYKWSLEHIMPTEAEWDKRYLTLRGRTGELTAFQGKLNNRADILACFKSDEEISEQIMQLYAYAKMRHDEDTRSAKYTAMSDRAEGLYTEYASMCSFITPELTKLSDAELNQFASDPELKDYDYFFRSIIKDKAHILSEKEEKLLAAGREVTGAYQDVFEMLDNADLNLPEITVDGKREQLTHGKYGMFMQNEDRNTRKRVFVAYYTAYKKLIHAIAATYNANVKKDWFYAKVRGYGSCLEKALAGEDVDPKVYENLIDSVNGNLEYLHRYIEYKKKALKLTKFYMYDMYVPIVSGSEIKLPYEEAYQLVKESLAPLGEDYRKLLEEAYTGGWIDVYENTGKRSGAYSFGIYSSHPYVMLNYQPTTNNVFTIAHELGHAMHSHYSNENQPQAKADYAIFVAEVASTVNEVLMLRHVIANSERGELKKYLLFYFLEMFRTTMFRQTQFAEFEHIVHGKTEKNEPLTYENMSDIYLNLNKKYYGRAVEDDGFIQYEWARIPHFYRAFYVYKYATGIISAVSIADSILKEGEPAVKRYKQFLSSGGSDSPVELLKIAGVDLTSKEPYQKAMKVFGDTLEELMNS